MGPSLLCLQPWKATFDMRSISVSFVFNFASKGHTSFPTRLHHQPGTSDADFYPQKHMDFVLQNGGRFTPPESDAKLFEETKISCDTTSEAPAASEGQQTVGFDSLRSLVLP